MSAVTVDRGAALKEWAAVVHALERGAQILILRKGGVREDGFSADTDAFYLYPTGFHQTPDKLRPEHRHLMDEALAERPPDGRASIRAAARVIETFAIDTQDKLRALAPEYVYTVEEILKRYEFRPGEPLTAMAVRVYRLPRAVDIAVKTKYGGCVSWIRLDDPIPTDDATPALSDADFQRRLSRVRALLQST
ncbi:MAG: hypothetical protein A3G34_06320 [Candidatus Lindowbacteria bacterium RIFCSPLOWO2_12_FULL_62_27]|nr:MAG: hypothetical protein A3G34_06320 [Candidatus Lindowbacteria bacterium RIFCSPLOWO2_12_FULL_62_27]OGH58778.1 MAG: hypothetical protein A3I06_09715 [Candidatus Lindowbacteria bacterium RIFCSPLOWO2_02_FULL_62_12]